MPRSSALLFVLLLLLPLSAPAQTAAADSPADPIEGPRVLLRTSMGDVTVQLDPQRAPLTVENFLRHAREGFYNGTVFHRVIENMLIQGGAFTVDLQARPNREPVPNEAAGTLSNLRGTLAAARAPGDADSHTTQFFINVVDNPRFDHRSSDDPYQAGYAVFGRVVAGMDVVDRIRAVETGARPPLPRDVPVNPVLIERVDVLEPEDDDSDA
ncbi:MAG: peptidylprolyl isomerase [Lysobacteraceae bacterium]